MGQDTWIPAGLVYRRDGSEADMYNLRKYKLTYLANMYIVTFLCPENKSEYTMIRTTCST